MKNVLTYILAYVIAVVAIILGATMPSKWFLAFGIASVLAVTWVAFWHGQGEPYFDLETRTIWAKFTHLAESATLPCIGVYVVAFVIAALVS